MSKKESETGSVDKPEVSETTSRRKLLTILGTGTVAAASIPGEWRKPAVDSVVLPVHANTTGTDGEPTGGDDPVEEPMEELPTRLSGSADISNIFVSIDKPAGLIDLLVSPAHAGKLFSATFDAYAEILANGSVKFQFKQTETGSCFRPVDTLISDDSGSDDDSNSDDDSSDEYGNQTFVSSGLGETTASGGMGMISLPFCPEKGGASNGTFTYVVAPDNANISVDFQFQQASSFNVTLIPGGSPLSPTECVLCDE